MTSIISCFIAFLYTLTIPPEYETSALLHVHQQTNSSMMIGRLGFKAGGESVEDTQEALIKTRYILEPVIIKNNLHINASPHYFHRFGAWKARNYHGTGIAKPFLGLTSYAWGGEEIKLKQFAVPENDVGKSFRLIAGKKNTYQVYSSEGKLVLSGRVGEQAISITDPGLSLELTTLKARPGTEFYLSYRSPISIVSSLTRNLRISNIFGNDPAQSTGIFQIIMTDSDSARVVNILNSILDVVVAKNAQANIQEAQKTLSFLEQRLPVLKENLEKSEDALNQYHIKINTLTMSMIGHVLMQQLETLTQTISRLKSQREELLQVYTPQHPLVIASLNKEEDLKKQLEKVKAEIRKFPLQNQTEITLLREAKIKNAAYIALLSNKEQLEIAKAGLSSNITILSNAVPAATIDNHPLLKILVGFLLGAFVSTIFVILRSALSQTIENSEHLEGELHIPVQSIVPFSKNQRQIEKTSRKGLPLVLAKQAPDDIAIESLRSLRVSLHIMFPSTTTRVVALMGSLSNIGKSFVSLNLSQVIADTGKRTLLIDADIRKGRLHHALHQPKTNGLSEYLEGQYDYEGLVRLIHDNLFFIPCGTYTNHPLELFQSQRFQDLLNYARRDFDQVIIDTPPILPVADSILIAKHCDTKLFVVSAAKDTFADVKQAIKKARANGIEIDGFVLNHRKPLLPYGSQSYLRYAYGTDK